MLEIMRMIANREIYPVYQPIIDITNNEVIGYEALARNPENICPEEMFRSANAYGLLRNLDTLCVYNAIENAPNGKTIFINIMPVTLVWLIISGKINKILDKVSQPIVFEIVEVERISGSLQELSLAVEKIKSYGFQVAIDDISQGFNRLQIIPLLCPDYIKIDRTLAINSSKIYNVITMSIINIAEEIGTKIIAEGVETKNEYKNLHNLGIEIYQGYYFAKPGEEYPNSQKIINV